MSSLIGAPNKPFVSNSKQERFKKHINSGSCVLLEGIPNDTTAEEMVVLINNFKIDVYDLFFPFNLLTQQQLPKVYICVKDRYAACLLICRIKNVTFFGKTVTVGLHKKLINF